MELKTHSKMFCRCKNGMGQESESNLHICPVCSGQPGTLPVPNRQAVEFVQLAGLALNCSLRAHSKFDRKNYFYPDLPKGYQISQYDQPLCEHGFLEIVTGDTGQAIQAKKIGITRIHLEEDTGKLVHPKGVNYSLVDLNRAGVPLMELVTEPDMENGTEARVFCQKLQQIFRYLGISDADMEKGNMRCEVNISLHQEDEEKLSGTKVEVKNINSFRFVEKAIDYEIKRQTEMLERGEKVVQETRGFDSNRNITVSQRAKESAHDYRYFPEPDIPPMEFADAYISGLRQSLPELPDQKAGRFVKEYQLPMGDVEVLTAEKEVAEFFEEVVSELESKVVADEAKLDRGKVIKLAANYVITELRKHMAQQGHTVRDLKITPENYAEFIAIVASGKVNSSAAQTVLREMYRSGGDPSQIISEQNLAQMDSAGELEKVVNEVLSKNQKSVEDYRSGRENAVQFLLGQVMAATKGKANPRTAMELLRKNLSA